METEKNWSNKKSCLMVIIYTIIAWSLIILTISLLGCSASPLQETNKTCNCDVLNDTIQTLQEKLNTLQNEKLNTLQNEKNEPQIWSASETGLVKGIVIRTDCANRGEENMNLMDNYITIKQPNGISTILRDVDEDVYLNIKVGDVIE